MHLPGQKYGLVRTETTITPERLLIFLFINKFSKFSDFLILLFFSNLWYVFSSSTFERQLVPLSFASLLLKEAKSASFFIGFLNNFLILSSKLFMEKEYAEYLLVKTRKDYNLIADDFSRTRDETWDEMFFLFENYLKPGDKVLDLGCGNGRWFKLFKTYNIDYIGVDSSVKLIDIAQKNNPEAKFQIEEGLELVLS